MLASRPRELKTMARKRKERWEIWGQDPNVRYALSNGGMTVQVPDRDGGFKTSGWCKLIGYSEEVTIRLLLHELGWKTPQRARA